MNSIFCLDQLPLQEVGKVKCVRSSDQSSLMARQLEDIGFVQGEHVQVLKRAWIGGDPMVVRVGLSTFALRKSEAQLIELEPHS
jgi:ferrous iron transport protein A